MTIMPIDNARKQQINMSYNCVFLEVSMDLEAKEIVPVAIAIKRNVL